MKTASPSRGETLAAFSVIVLLAVIGIGILQVRQTPNPAVTVYEEAARVSAPPTAAGDRIPIPDGFSAMSPPEVFDPDTLSDKIDGKAELYLSAGFEQLSTRRLTAADAGDAWMELFAYRMEDHRSAFSVFSAQQRREAQPLERYRYGYRSENALFFVHGPFYVEIVSSAAVPDADSLLRLADAFAAAHTVSDVAVPERQFLARYRLENAELTAFVSKRDSAAEAGELVGAYADFLVRFGGTPQTVDFPARGARLVEIFGVYELIFSVEQTFAGVHEAEDPAAAVELGRRLYEHLSGGAS